jgi:hypothetical protein
MAAIRFDHAGALIMHNALLLDHGGVLDAMSARNKPDKSRAYERLISLTPVAKFHFKGGRHPLLDGPSRTALGLDEVRRPWIRAALYRSKAFEIEKRVRKGVVSCLRKASKN